MRAALLPPSASRPTTGRSATPLATILALALPAALVALGAGCNMLTGAEELVVDEGMPTAAGGGTSTGTGTGTGSGNGSAQGGAGVGGGQTGGTGGATIDPCEGVDCGPNGVCAWVGAEATCDCDSGYHAAGLGCEPDVPPGPCETVTCGSNATCHDGICDCNDGFEGDPDSGCTTLNPTEEDMRAELVAIATAELGMCEGVDNRPYMLGQPGLWCYDFVAWVYQQSSYSLPSPLSLPRYTVGELPEWWRPEPGDLIKFTIQHYGMVASVSGDGQTITTIEGNFNSCVMSRSISDPSVEYYGTLDDAL